MFYHELTCQVPREMLKTYAMKTHKFNHNAAKITKMFGHYFWLHRHYLADFSTHCISVNLLLSDYGRSPGSSVG